jgi:hypothetical protein
MFPAQQYQWLCGALVFFFGPLEYQDHHKSLLQFPDQPVFSWTNDTSHSPRELSLLLHREKRINKCPTTVPTLTVAVYRNYLVCNNSWHCQPCYAAAPFTVITASPNGGSSRPPSAQIAAIVGTPQLKYLKRMCRIKCYDKVGHFGSITSPFLATQKWPRNNNFVSESDDNYTSTRTRYIHTTATASPAPHQTMEIQNHGNPEPWESRTHRPTCPIFLFWHDKHQPNKITYQAMLVTCRPPHWWHVVNMTLCLSFGPFFCIWKYDIPS